MSANKLQEARSIFKKFHRRQLYESGGLAVCEAWLRFERENGSVQDLRQAAIKTKPVLSEALAAATAAANPQTAAETKVSLKDTKACHHKPAKPCKNPVEGGT